MYIHKDFHLTCNML